MFARMDSAAAECEPIYARVAENAGRLALIVAVGCNPDAPIITADIMRWACAVALASAEMLMTQAEDRVADNDRQAEYKKVRAIVAEAGRKGITQKEIVRRLKGVMDKRRLDDILEMLATADEIVNARISGPKGGRPVFRYYIAGLEPPAEPPEKEAA
jgi:hypothetical protein